MAISTPHNLSVFNGAVPHPLAITPSAGPRPVPLPPFSTFTVFTGTTGKDNFTGTNGIDTFNMGDGGKDTVSGKNGDDTFNFGAALDPADTIDGGNAVDLLVLDGDYSAGLIFGATTMRNVETLQLTAGHSYFLTLDNSNVLLGQYLVVNGISLGAADVLIFDGSDETSSQLFVAGGAGNDTLIGGGGNDVIGGFAGAGNDTVSGGDGDDTLSFTTDFNAFDRVNGGAGFDSLSLSGDYSAGVTLLSTTLHDVERIRFQTTNIYNLTLDNLNVGIAQTLTIDGHLMTAGGAMTIDGSAVADGNLNFLGGAGADTITIGQNGFDQVKAGDGDDLVRAFGNLQETDRIDGGASVDDFIELDGDYSDRLTFQSHTIRNVEHLDLVAGHDYNLVLADGNVAASGFFDVNGSTLGASDTLTFDASAESSANLNIFGGAAADVIAGGAGNDGLYGGLGDDIIDATRGGDDTLQGGDGNDTFLLADTLTDDDTIDGGIGNDVLLLDGDYSGQELPEVETVRLAPGHSYSLLGMSHVGPNLTIDGGHLGSGDDLSFSAFGSDTSFKVYGGAGQDFLRGGNVRDDLFGSSGDDRLIGAGGTDFLYGGAGGDTFDFAAVNESTSINRDRISAPNFSEDKISTLNIIDGVDAALTSGVLSGVSQGQFDAHLTQALNGHLLADHAILFTPDSGGLAGSTFLIIDMNHIASYQASQDIVIQIVSGFTGNLDSSDFI